MQCQEFERKQGCFSENTSACFCSTTSSLYSISTCQVTYNLTVPQNNNMNYLTTIPTTCPNALQKSDLNPGLPAPSPLHHTGYFTIKATQGNVIFFCTRLLKSVYVLQLENDWRHLNLTPVPPTFESVIWKWQPIAQRQCLVCCPARWKGAFISPQISAQVWRHGKHFSLIQTGLSGCYMSIWCISSS